ncbi:ATP-binding protein [Planctomicrobium sp. SH661]|uniref:hybrid sensor histidine kinase/response regulator n=1 Tax=Planctomicrobium sp. SH661 TaxID=3448124 RepID=UPI003F5BE176
MWNWLTSIFETADFPPRWACGPGWKNEPLWGWLHIVSDLATFAAYVAIPIVFIYFLRKRRDLPLPRLWWLFATFIFACGTVHLLEAVIFWWPVYRLSGIIKFLTAIASWATVLALLPLIPQALSIRFPAEGSSPTDSGGSESKRLMESRSKFIDGHLRGALLASRMGTWSWNLKTNLLWLDSMEMQLTGLGLKGGQISSEQFFERVHRDDREGLDRAVQSAMQPGVQFNHIFRLYVPEKGYRWLHGRGAVVLNAQRIPERMIGINFDITDQMADQEALRVRTRAIEFATNGILITDARSPDQPIIYANPAFEILTGYRADEVLGRSCSFLQGPGTDERTRLKLREAIRLRQECHVTILNYRKDGTPFWNNLQISPVENDEGTVIHFVGVQTDVTERVENERQLRETQLAAESASRAKSEFLANMSHEIRTPLTAILGCADSLCRELNGAEPLATAKTIRSQGQLLTGILNDILDLSKIEAGKLEIHREPCSVLSIVADVRSLMDQQAVEKRLELITTFESMLPETISTDPLRFRQVLLNLTSNAIKFTEKGQVRIHVRCDRREGNPKLVVSVSDTGIGIPPDRLDSIFEAFTQIDGSIVRRAGGTGLGLTICQRLAEMLDGELTVVSEVNRGSTFSISLPVDSDAMLSYDELNQRRKLKESHESMDILIPARILIAEDTRAIQYMLQRILSPVVDEVVVVNNGEEAVDAVINSQQSQPFSLVLMDMQMPIMNGYDATERLRSLGFDLPVIALTAGAMAGDRERCLAVGCTDYLAKPVGRSQLLTTIQTYCSRPLERG